MATTKAYEIGQLGSKLTVDSDGDIALNAINGLVVDTSTLTVDPNNNRVGIGTTTPSQPFQVQALPFVVTSARVGVGTTNPNDTIEVQANNPTIRLVDTSTSARNQIYNNDGTLTLQTTGNNELAFRPNTTTAMTITGAGSVGIGSATPNYKLDVYSSTSDWPIRGKSGDAKAGFIISDINTTNYIISYENKMSLGQSSDVDSSNVTILDNGRVGIGTTNPQSPLTVKSNSISSQSSGIVLRASDNANTIAAIGERSDGGGRFHLYDDFNETVAFYATSDKSFINTGGDFAVDSDTLYVDASTNRVGVGTLAPNNALDVHSGVASDIMRLGNDNGSYVFGYTSNLASIDLASTANMRIRAGSNELLRLQPDGDVGIGTNVPNANGSKTTVHINNTTNGAAIRLSQGSSSSLIRYDTTNGLKVGTIAAETLTLQTNDTDRFEIDSAGLITVYNHIKPDTTLSYDLGDSDLRFRDIYLSGQTINMAGTKLTLDSAGDLEIKDRQNNFKRIRAKELEFDDEDADDTFKTVLKKDDNGRMSFIKVNRTTGVEVDSAEVLDLSANTTADLPEHTTAKFFTDARARSAVTKAHVDGLNVDADTLDGIQGGQYLRNGLYHNHSAATNPKYFKIGQISDNNGSFKVSGLVGGHSLDTTQGAGSVDIEIFNRYGTTHVQGRVSGQVGDNDILVQRNTDSDLEIWVKGVTYSLIDLQYNETYGATSYYNPSSTTTAPTGTNIWLASDHEATNNGETNILNELYVNGNRALTVADEGTGNGLDADTVDGLQASQFLRNDQDGTLTGNLAVTGDLTLEDSRVYFDTTAGQVVYASGGGGVLNLASDGYVHFIETDANPDSVRITADVNNTRFGIGVTPSQALDVSGNIKLTGRIYGPSTMYIDPSAHDSDTGTVVIAGNLQVDGTQTIVNSTTVSINDKNLLLADSATTPSLADGAGLTFGDYDSAATLTFDAASDRLKTQKDVRVQGVGGSGSSTRISVLNDSDGAGHPGAEAYLQSSGWGQARLQVGSNYIQQAGGKMQISSNNQKVTWTSIGNFGINVGDPLDRLHVSGNIRIQNNNEIRTLDTGGTARTITRVNASDELEYGWSGAGPVKIMGGGSYTERMRVHTDGNVGIGTANPQDKLHVHGTVRAIAPSNNDWVFLGYNSQNTASSGLWYTNDHARFLGRNASNTLTIDLHASGKSYLNGGNVGIGTADPSAKLAVYGNGLYYSNNYYLDLDRSGDSGYHGIQISSTGDARGYLGLAGSTGHFVSGSQQYDLVLRSESNLTLASGGSNPRVTILSTGNVGIGTTGPDAPLEISTTGTNGWILHGTCDNSSFLFQEYNEGAYMFLDGSNGDFAGGDYMFVASPQANLLTMGNGVTNVLSVVPGKVGIGTTNPSEVIHVKSTTANFGEFESTSTSNGNLIINKAGASGNPNILFQGAGSNKIYLNVARNDSDKFKIFTTSGGEAARFTVQQDGKVGIGTETPSEKLEVYGNIKHQGLTMTSGTDVDQLYSTTLSWTPTTDWTDTGINYTDLSTGSYIVQVFIDDSGDGASGYHYDEYYTGVMSWFAAGTNSTVTDEIPLHRAGHAPNNAEIFLRTQRHGSSDGNHLMLQIAGGYSHSTAVTVSFKFRRMI